MGRNAAAVTDPKQAVDRFTDEAIVAGDLLWMAEKGLAKKIPSGSSIPLYSSDSAGFSVVKALATVEPSTVVEYRRAGVPSAAQLGDSLIVAYQTASGTGLNLVKRSLTGETIGGPSTITASAVYAYLLVKLSETKVALVWTTVSSTINARIYDSNLDTVGSLITVTTNSTGEFALNSQFDACALSNGNLLVAWRTNTGSDCLARVWSLTDATAVTADLDVFLTGTPTSIAVCALDSAGFAVSWFSTTYQFARFNAAGAIVGSIVSVAGSTNEISFGYSGNRLVKFSDNGLVMQYGTSNAKPQFNIYNSSNSLVLAINPSSNAEQNELIAAMCATEAGFAFAVHMSKTLVTIFEYSSTGTLLRTFSITFATEQDDLLSNEGAMLFEVPGQGFIYIRNSTDGTTYTIAWAMVGLDGRLIGNIISDTQSSAYGSLHAVVTSNNMLFIHFYHTTMKEVIYNIGRKSIIGVALSAAASSKVKVARKGVYTLTETYTKGGVFDAETYDVQGTRGIVNGAQATLFGVTE